VIVIEVKVSDGASGSGGNSLSIAGGGAVESTSVEPTTFSESPARFGLPIFEQSAIDNTGATDVQAGSHPYEITTSFMQNNVGPGEGTSPPLSGEFKDFEVGLPPGLVGNPNAVPKCPRALFDIGRQEAQSPECPANTQVGDITLNLGNPFVHFDFPVYNLEPPAGVVAQFGFAFQYRVGFIDFGVRTGEGYAVRVILHNVDQFDIIYNSLRLWDLPGEHGTGAPITVPLLRNPTSCGAPLSNLVSMDSWEEPVAQPAAPFSYPVSASYPVIDDVGNPVAMSGCNKLNFNPSFEAAPTTSAGGSASGLHVDVHVPQNEAPGSLAESDLKDAVVTLPAGMTVNPGAADGLAACGSAQVDLTGPGPAECPDASKIGTVEVDTPLVGHPLPGAVYLAAQGDNPFGSLLAIYLTVDDPVSGVVVKLAGRVDADPVTGQLKATVKENPQLPFEDFKLDLFGGPRAPLVTPPACGTFASTGEFASWARPDGLVAQEAPFTISSGVGGGPCPSGGLAPFAPRVTAGTLNNTAGSYSPLSLRLARGDGEQDITGFSLRLPAGLTANLSGIPFCSEEAIARAASRSGSTEEADPSCPSASLIGHSTVGAGVGSSLVWVGGRVYLAGPYDGAPFSVVDVTPAKAGPFDLGTVVVREALRIDPHSTVVTAEPATAGSIPRILDGIVLHIRDIRVSVDRSLFMLNPTSCDRMTVSATLTGSGADPATPADDVPVTVASPFQAADCPALKFKPVFKASVTGKTSRKNGAGLTVKLNFPAAGAGSQANIRAVKVELPKQLPSRLGTLQSACPEAVFAGNPAACPSGSRVGTATAITPIVPVPLAGPAYFVSHGGAKFPELVMVLQGYGLTVQLNGETFIDKNGVTSSTFHAIPDQPVTSFELSLPAGPGSALAANTNLCTFTNTVLSKKKVNVTINGRKRKLTRTVKKTVPGVLTMPTQFIAQNGMTLGQSTPIVVTGCPKHAILKGHGKGAHHKK
jgi:hypothetical protein